MSLPSIAEQISESFTAAPALPCVAGGSCVTHVDALTGLAARASALAWFDKHLRTHAQPAGVILLSIDRFGLVNASLGHRTGDGLLVQLAQRVEATVRSELGPNAAERVRVARTGGSEFAVLASALPDGVALDALADRLDHDLAQPVEVESHQLQVRATLGVAARTPRSGSPRAEGEAVFRDAQIALRQAKLSLATRATFDPAMREQVCRRMQLELALHHALRHGGLSLNYQPIISFATGEVAGFEALVRWTDPVLGAISPAEFIPIAEETGLVLPLGEWVLSEACRQLAAWRCDGLADPTVTMSVNLSRVQMHQQDLVAMVLARVEEAGLCPGAGDLHLEVTESSIMTDPQRAVAVLHDLRKAGVSISMDDFGTQYSSLACLHQFPLNTIKIDRAFIRNLDQRREYGAVVHAIVTLAHNLDMKVVAEGIETADQAVELLAMECDAAQGYHFARPLAAADAGHYLATYQPPALGQARATLAA